MILEHLPNPQVFFDTMDDDWRQDIEAIWPDYAATSKVYLLKDNTILVAGGIVFSQCPPDMLYALDEANKWFESGHLYIGYVWVPHNFRGQGLGSKWLKALYKQFPSQKYWLTVEEEGLIKFYGSNGFRLIKTMQNGPQQEWLLTYDPEVK